MTESRVMGSLLDGPCIGWVAFADWDWGGFDFLGDFLGEAGFGEECFRFVGRDAFGMSSDWKNISILSLKQTLKLVFLIIFVLNACKIPLCFF